MRYIYRISLNNFTERLLYEVSEVEGYIGGVFIRKQLFNDFTVFQFF